MSPTILRSRHDRAGPESAAEKCDFYVSSPHVFRSILLLYAHTHKRNLFFFLKHKQRSVELVHVLPGRRILFPLNDKQSKPPTSQHKGQGQMFGIDDLLQRELYENELKYAVFTYAITLAFKVPVALIQLKKYIPLDPRKRFG